MEQLAYRGGVHLLGHGLRGKNLLHRPHGRRDLAGIVLLENQITWSVTPRETSVGSLGGGGGGGGGPSYLGKHILLLLDLLLLHLRLLLHLGLLLLLLLRFQGFGGRR